MTELDDDSSAEYRPAPRWAPDEEAVGDDTSLAWEGRVFAVAIAWALPGVVFGLLVGLFAALSATGSALAGGLMGALAGGLLEAEHWP